MREVKIWGGDRNTPCTLDLNILGQKVKKRSTISVGKSWWDCGLHTWVPGFHGTWKSWENTNATKPYFRCTAKCICTKLVPSPAGTRVGMTKVLCGGEGGWREEKSQRVDRIKLCRGCTMWKLEGIRQHRIWPEDAVNGSLSQQSV